jgi:hypothetical protein
MGRRRARFLLVVLHFIDFEVDIGSALKELRILVILMECMKLFHASGDVTVT